MRRRNGFVTLLDELSAMPAISRRAILRALSPSERDALADFSEGLEAREPTVFSTSPFSPWLAARIDAVQSNSSLDLAASRMTEAAKQALVRSADAISGQAGVKPKAPTGKSLFDAFGGKLVARMGRP